MAVKVANILVGAGKIAYHDPAHADADADGFVDFGATIDGVEITFEPEYGEVEVDQLKDAARLFNQGLQVSMRTNLAEMDLTRLAIVWGYDPADVLETGASPVTENSFVSGNYERLNMVVPDECPVENRIRVEGKAPSDCVTVKKRFYEARRVVSVEGSNHTLSKSEATVMPVTFRLLPDPTYSGSEYGFIIDETE